MFIYGIPSLNETRLNRLQHIQNALARVLQIPGPPFLIIFSNSCTGSRYSSALNRKLALAHISSFSLLLHVIPARSYHSPAFSIHSIIHISYSSQPSVDSTPLQSQHHKPLLPVCRASPVKQASSYYSSCSLSVRSFIITQLFSIVML